MIASMYLDLVLVVTYIPESAPRRRTIGAVANILDVGAAFVTMK